MDSSRRRTAALCDQLGVGDDDLEGGEYVPGRYESDDEVLHPQHGGRMRRLEDIVGGAPLPPPSPTPSSESEGTISDDGGHRSVVVSYAGVVVAGAPARNNFACHECGKGFSSRKAVDGHMRVHATGRHVVAQPAFVSAGWAATGKRGWAGGKPSATAAASLNSESTGHSTAVVAAQQAVSMAFAMTNLSPLPSSTRTNLSGEDDEGSSASATAQPMHHDEPLAAAAAVVTGANPSSTDHAGAGARARAGPLDDHQLAAADQAPAPHVHCQAVSVPPPAAQQAAHFAQQPPVPLPAAAVQLHQQGQLVMPQPAVPPREYSCKRCGKAFSTHQGLGGHAAGHRNRDREQEAMAAAAGMMMMPHGGGVEFLAAFRRGAGAGRKAEAHHPCQQCPKVFTTGVALGGHMRKHYTGPAIVHKSKKRCVAPVADTGAPPPPPAVTEADLIHALAAARTEEPSSSTAPAVAAGTGRLRLFGFDIAPLGQQAPPSEQQGSGKTEEGSSSAGEQQNK